MRDRAVSQVSYTCSSTYLRTAEPACCTSVTERQTKCLNLIQSWAEKMCLKQVHLPILYSFLSVLPTTIFRRDNSCENRGPIQFGSISIKGRFSIIDERERDQAINDFYMK